MKLRAENIALNCGFCKKSLQVPFCEEKSVQLFRVAFFRSDFLQNPYFRWQVKFKKRLKNGHWSNFKNQNWKSFEEPK